MTRFVPMGAAWLSCGMRVVVLSLALAACGRLGFGAADDDDGDRSDEPTPDAVACVASGHDEDGDGLDDGCDVCPTVADLDQVDGDADGVGDACDPRPTTGGDRIGFYDPFVILDPARYTFFNTVAHDPDAHALQLAPDSDTGYALFTGPSAFTRAAISVRVQGVAPPATRWVGLWTHIDGALSEAVFASADDGGGGGGGGLAQMSIKEAIDGEDRLSADAFTGQPIDGLAFTLTFDTDLATGGDAVLTTSSTVGAFDPVTTSLDLSRAQTGVFELEASSLEVLVDYVIIYE